MSEVVEEQSVETPAAGTPESEAPAEPDVPFEEPAPEPDEEEEAEAVDEPQQLGPTPEELERMLKSLTRSATTWRNRVSELMGEAANDLVPCELCDPNIPGFHWPAELEHPRDDRHAHLLEVLKNPLAPEYQLARHVRQCGDCGGWGSVLSGSRVAGKERVTCPTCKGQGFQGDAIHVMPVPQQEGNGAVEFPQDQQPLSQDDADAWGSPRLLDDGQENPNWGRAPSYKNPTLP